MMLKIFNASMAIIIFTTIHAFSQIDTARPERVVTTDEVVVTAARVPMLWSEAGRVLTVIGKEEIANAPARSIQDLLEYAVNVDVRQRGNFGVQSDISMRGGTFDQTLILLNGIKINDPQTGHHNMNLPIELDNVERIEILQGPASRVYGPNAFSGAINIITNSADRKNLHLSLSEGEYNTYSASAGGCFTLGRVDNYVSFTKKNSEGYIANTDYNLANFFYRGGAGLAGGRLEVQAGYTDKAFGANSFYSAKYPDQFEHTRTTFATMKYTTGTELRFTPSIYWRRHNDKFELFRNSAPSWYKNHNYHRTDVLGGGANLSYISGLGTTSAGVEVRYEGILSNVLGTPLSSPIDVPGENGAKFTKSADRVNTSFFLEHSFTAGICTASFGVMLNDNSDFGIKAFPGIDVNLRITGNASAFASANKALRIPTFTDLYYSAPNMTANPNLKPEEAAAYEIGLKYTGAIIKSHVSLFHRAGTNLIDWGRPADSADAKWQSMNLTSVNADGIELAVSFYPKNEFTGSPVKSLNIAYNYLAMDKSAGKYISQYVLDYLNNKLSFSLDHELPLGAGAAWKLTYEDRQGKYTEYATGRDKDYEPFFNLDLRAYYNIKNYGFYIEGTNLLNAHYYDISNVPVPGRALSAGVTMNIDWQ